MSRTTPETLGYTCDQAAVGLHAQQALARARCEPLRVLAVVSDAAYLASADGDLVWISQSDVPMHTRAISCRFDLQAMRAGMVLNLDVPNAKTWHPLPIRHERVASIEAVFARAASLDTAVTFDPLAPHVARMQGACRRRDLLHILEIGRDVAGLGPGLTPSGDDFLGGVLFAVCQLHSIYPVSVGWDAQALADFLTWARLRTNVISHAILSDHAHGDGAEPLHDLMRHLLEGNSKNDAAAAADRVRAIGSTSGTEMLAGMLTGMLVLN